MKKIHLLLLGLTICLFSACHNDIWDAIDGLDSRVTKLEELCKEMNTNITSLQTIVDVLQSNDFITGVVEIKKDGEVIGYTITFGKHDPITIYHGQDGKDGQDGQNGADGKDGSTPVIGVAQDTDGVYYWTLNGEWLLDDNGNKLPVSGKDGQNGTNGSNGQDGADGKDGQDGEDGKDGADGQDGKDGITPQLKIEDGYWYISYDNGATWTQLGRATGEDGQDGKDGADGEDGKDGQNGADGKDGQDGDSMFQSVTQDENYVYFTLADGTVIKIAKGNGNNHQPHGEDIIEFRDLAMYSALSSHIPKIDTNNDGYISYNEAANYSGTLSLKDNVYIRYFDEFKYFTGTTSCTFENCSKLFMVTLPTSINCIEEKAFRGCNALINCILPDGIIEIPTDAFNGCSSLNSITIPNSVRLIRYNSLRGTSCLTEFTFPENYDDEIGVFGYEDGIIPKKIIWNTTYYMRDYQITPYGWSGATFRGIAAVRISSSGTIGKLNNYTIEFHFGERVKNIPAYLCYGFTGLTEITIPAGIEIIGNAAFALCQMEKIYCKRISPPKIGSSVFPTTATIYVPRESVDAYKSSWSDYVDKIVGYDFE